MYRDRQTCRADDRNISHQPQRRAVNIKRSFETANTLTDYTNRETNLFLGAASLKSVDCGSFLCNPLYDECDMAYCTKPRSVRVC